MGKHWGNIFAKYPQKPTFSQIIEFSRNLPNPLYLSAFPQFSGGPRHTPM